jgi:hypothetical protein
MISMVLLLVTLTRAVVFTHVEDIENKMLSSQFDIFLSDIKQEELGKISKLMEFSLNSPTLEKPTLPIDGIIYGNLDRFIVPLIVQHNNIIIKTLFIFDTGSPWIFLSQKTLAAVGINDIILPEMNIKVHGEMMVVSPSTNHFSEVNVIGYRFLNALKIEAHIFLNRTVVFTKGGLDVNEL